MAAWNPAANAIFLNALEIQTSEEREAYLAQACGGDASLHSQVQALLRAHAEAGSFLEKPAPSEAAPGANGSG